MPTPLTLEGGAVAALAQLAALDIERARAVLDSTAVTPDHVAHPVLRQVLTVIEAMIRDGRPPDLFAIEARLPKVPRTLLVQLLIDDPSAPPAEPGLGYTVEQRLRLVREAALRRRATEALVAGRTLLNNPSTTLSDAAAEVQRAMELIASESYGVRTADADVLKLIDHLAEVDSGKREPVMPTYLEALDAVIGGLRAFLTIIGALPGVGKSGLIAAIIKRLAEARTVVGLISLEDEAGWLVDRLVSEQSGVPLFVLKNRRLTTAQQRRVGDAAERVHGLMSSVLVDDRPALTTAEVISSARTMLARGAKAIFIDHLGEVRLKRSDRHDLDIVEVLQELRGLAKMHRVPVVVVCHLKRRDGLGPKDEPRITDFAFSAGVERMARVALALSKPNDGVLRVHVLKQTQGVSNVAVDLPFDGPSALVGNAPAAATREKVDLLYPDSPEVTE